MADVNVDGPGVSGGCGDVNRAETNSNIEAGYFLRVAAGNAGDNLLDPAGLASANISRSPSLRGCKPVGPKAVAISFQIHHAFRRHLPITHTRPDEIDAGREGFVRCPDGCFVS